MLIITIININHKGNSIPIREPIYSEIIAVQLTQRLKY